MTASTLSTYSQHELARLAKKYGVAGWHAMRKEELVKALLKATRPPSGAPARRRAADTRSQTKTRARPSTAASSGPRPVRRSRAKASAGPARKSVGKVHAASSQRSATAGKQAKAAAKPKAGSASRSVSTIQPTKAAAAKRNGAVAARATAAARNKNGAVRHKKAGRRASNAASDRLVRDRSGHKTAVKSSAVSKHKRPAGASAPGKGKVPPKPAAASSAHAAAPDPKVQAQLAMIKARLQQAKDLAAAALSNQGNGQQKDRLVAMVRDPYWLHACWEISRQAVDRAKAALAQEWHSAVPILRVWQVETTGGGSRAETLLRDIEIHGGVSNWYVDVKDPPKAFRLDIGYKATSGQFYCITRSNIVSTPRPGSSDSIDQNWNDVAANFDRIYALSGGYASEGHSQDLQELFEERLRRPMGAPLAGSYGAGVEALLPQKRDFFFEIDAELIVFGATDPEAHVTLQGEPVKLRPDGTFTVRFSLPNCRQVIPAVASSRDGIEQRTVVLAIERNTKTMEPVIRDSNEP